MPVLQQLRSELTDGAVVELEHPEEVVGAQELPAHCAEALHSGEQLVEL